MLPSMAPLLNKLNVLAAWHSKTTDKVWLTPVRNRNYAIFTIILIGLAIFAASHMRHWQYDQWKANNATFYLEETPLFSTTDASYFLNTAKAIKETGSGQAFAKKRSYPSNVDLIESDKRTLFDEPLLSVALATLAPDSSNESLLKTANDLLPWTAALTALAIVLAFGAAGFWAEGAIAAIGGTLSFSYLVRSSIGRIDTDQLNLGFFYLVTAFVVWAAKSKNLALSVGMSIVAGLTNNIFSWWWSKDILSWGFLGGLIWLSFLCHRDWRRSVALAVLFAMTSGTFWSGGTVAVTEFTSNVTDTGSLILPNTFTTITELARIPFGDVLSNLTGDVWLGLIALIGLAGWAFVNPVVAIVFVPALMLSLLNVVFGNRVIFFSAPIIWFGIGWLILTAGRFIGHRILTPKTDQATKVQPVTASISILIGAAIAYLSSGNPLTKPYVPDPSFRAEIIDGFRNVGAIAKQQQSNRQPIIATWWDYGYAATLFSGLPTLHDGGSQRGIPTHLVARALLAGSQYETAQILKFVANDGTPGIVANADSNETLNQAFIAGPKNDTADIYLVVTLQMARWMTSISALGLWNTQTGEPVLTNNGTNKVSFQTVQCSGSGNTATCNGQLYDFGAGTIDGQPVLRSALKTNNGIVGAQATYENQNGYHVQLHDINEKTFETQVIDPVLFNSTFNKLFFLGAVDEAYFTPVFDAYPFYRVYKVN